MFIVMIECFFVLYCLVYLIGFLFLDCDFWMAFVVACGNHISKCENLTTLLMSLMLIIYYERHLVLNFLSYLLDSDDIFYCINASVNFIFIII